MGRQPEVADLKLALEDTISGQGRLVMLAGEPGIGKTRTAQKLAFHADTLGAQVLWGRCYEEEGAPPHWPWLQILSSYIQQQAPKQLQAEMGPGAADIAEMVPEMRHKLTGLETPPALEPEQACFHFFSSITNFLKNAAQSQPLMLVLEDFHWVDQPSLQLLSMGRLWQAQSGPGQYPPFREAAGREVATGVKGRRLSYGRRAVSPRQHWSWHRIPTDPSLPERVSSAASARRLPSQLRLDQVGHCPGDLVTGCRPSAKPENGGAECGKSARWDLRGSLGEQSPGPPSH